MNKKIVISLIVLMIFLVGCGEKEPSLIEKARIAEEARLAATATKANQTIEPPKEVIPAEFLETCIYNQKIELFSRRDMEICINDQSQLAVNINNIGFDPINSVKLIIGTKEYISEENDLSVGMMRIYRFEGVSLEGIGTIQVIPQGRFYDGEVYDCKASKLTYEVKDIGDCII